MNNKKNQRNIIHENIIIIFLFITFFISFYITLNDCIKSTYNNLIECLLRFLACVILYIIFLLLVYFRKSSKKEK